MRPLGVEYFFSPVARPVKFSTVSGAWFGNRVMVMSPRLVLRMACRSAMTAFRVLRVGGRAGAAQHGAPGPRDGDRLDPATPPCAARRRPPAHPTWGGRSLGPVVGWRSTPAAGRHGPEREARHGTPQEEVAGRPGDATRPATTLDALRPHVESAYGQAKDFVQDTAIPALADAKDKAGPALVDARDKAGPALADARDKAVPVAIAARRRHDARDKAAPVWPTPAPRPPRWSPAAPRSPARRPPLPARWPRPRSPRSRARSRRSAASSRRSRSSPPSPAASPFVAKKLQGGGQSDNWQSSYTPTPARPTPSPTSAAAGRYPALGRPAVEDPGGAGPDEAIADAAEAPHPVTTPDEPAEVVEIDPDTKS